jgi:integrase
MAEKIPFGEAGKIYTPKLVTNRVGKGGKKLPDKWQTSRRIHTLYGVVKEIEAWGNSPEEAIENLSIKTQKRLAMPGGSSLLNGNSLVRTAAEACIAAMESEAGNSNPRIKFGTIAGYERIYANGLHRLVGDVRLKDVTPALFQMVINQIATEHSEDYARKAAAVMKHICATAIMHNVFTTNPMLAVKPPRRVQLDVIAFSAAEIAEIRHALWADGKAKFEQNPDDIQAAYQWAVLVELLIATAMRFGEALACQWGQIGEIDGQPVLDINGTMTEYTKDGIRHHERSRVLKKGTAERPKHRTVFLSKTAYAALMLIKPADAQPTDYIFNNIDRQGNHGTMPYKSTTARSNIVRRLKKAELDHIQVNPHKFRKTTATVVRDGSGYMETASRLLGHVLKEEQTVTNRFYIQSRKNICPNVNDIIETYLARCSRIEPLPEIPGLNK